MINTLPRLSVWEISCRINELNPSEVDIKKIPPQVKDALKSITRAFHYDENMHVLSSNGIENHHIYNSKTDTFYENKAVHEKISDCYEKEIFDKDFLDAIFIEDEDFVKWCAAKNISLPKFWFPNGWNPINFQDHTPSDNQHDTDHAAASSNPRSNQIDKIACQAIARTLWDIYPITTIADMCKHDAIQRYGNGRLYIGAHTLRDWLSEVAPANIKGKKGRPKKSES